MLDGNTSTQEKSRISSKDSVQSRPIPDESPIRWETEIHALSKARAELEQALQQSQDNAAKAEAQLQNIHRNIDELRQEAVKKGHETGYHDGEKAGREAYDTQLEQLKNLVSNVRKNQENRILESEDDIVEIVFASVSKILGDAMIEPDAVISIVKQSINQLVSRDQLTIHLSAKDKRLIDSILSEREEPLFDDAVNIVADERVQLGGCILQTNTGGLDARLEVQLQQLRDCLLSVATKSNTERSE
jgi:flagellar biosynthesis/type III secretory pathway protein FliH